MADHTHIEWTDATWNPITGCSVVSAGCKHCYAMKLAGTRLRDHQSRTGLTIDTNAGPVWTGEVRFNRQWLDQPLRWRRPRRIFVCAHGDLFHEAVPDEWIDQVFAVMALAPHHQFQVLTKRAARMQRYMADDGQRRRDSRGAAVLALDPLQPLESLRWPLPNVWLGVSVEDQAAADERIPLLLATPAHVRWISAEPLLGPLNFRWTPYAHRAAGETYREYLERTGSVNEYEALRKLDWVVAGGESGPGARPMHPDWARSLRDQCAAAGVPFLFKQWGEWLPGHQYEDTHRRRDPDPAQSRFECAQRDGATWDIGVRHSLDVYDNDALYRIGKMAAGRHLDGVLHDGYPKGRA